MPETDEEKFLCSGYADRLVQRKADRIIKGLLKHLDLN